MSFHSGQTFTFGETPSATKWNYLWENDYALADGTGISDGVIGNRHFATGVCVQEVGTTLGTVATGTTLIPIDNTIPQNTEGDQYMTLTITPKSTTNILIIEVVLIVADSVIGNPVVALFQDSTASALRAVIAQWAVDKPMPLNFKHRMVAGTTSATTFKVRAGGQTAGTLTINGIAGTQYLGGVLASSITIREYKAS